MNLNIRAKHLKTLKKQNGSDIEEVRWRGEDQKVSLDIHRFTDEDLIKLRAILQSAKDPTGKPEAGVLSDIRKINTFFKLRENLTGTPIHTLDALVEAVRKFMAETQHRWVFTQENDGEMVAYYVESARYYPPNERNEEVAHTIISLISMCRRSRETRTLRFEMDNIGYTVGQILESRGYYRETPEMVNEYEAVCARYQVVSNKTGAQFLASGKGFTDQRYYGNSTVEMEVDEQPTRVVMDDVFGDESDREAKAVSGIVSGKFYREGQRLSDAEEEDAANAEEYAVLPLQPYVKVFDLVKHQFVTINVANLEDYAYDETMVQKLILPEHDKNLIEMLVQGADEQMEDIVKGKTGGIIVIATGPPGTGKTLTAETFSELVKRPLYCVQCSQLGTNEVKLEDALGKVLARATRWQAILLIDEADVYVHERGSDICQNAIVGVWLRILEHYRGIMFLTSNRSTIIDDAIMSRATAWIRYDRPTKELLRHIWQVLSVQYQVALTAEMITALVSGKLQSITGRTVKNLLKLARLLSRRTKQTVTVEMVESVSRYLDIESAQEDKGSNLLPYPVPMSIPAFKRLQQGGEMRAVPSQEE